MPDTPDLSAVTTIFFDLDGVLADSRGPITHCINAALRASGLAEEPVDLLAPWIGISLNEVFETLLRDRSADIARAPELIAAYRELYRSVSVEETRPFPGIPEAVSALASQHKLAVATSKPATFSVPILEVMGIAEHFEEVFAPPEANTHHEDKTGTLGRGVRHFGIDSTPAKPRAVMIGDRHVDVNAGRTHQLATVGVAWGIGGADELRSAGADFIVSEVSDLVRLLGRRR